jgi:hypothetical protein
MEKVYLIVLTAQIATITVAVIIIETILGGICDD